jgi:hypothetical protein
MGTVALNDQADDPGDFSPYFEDIEVFYLGTIK